MIRDIVEESGKFQEIHITEAGCTISSHCGPNTLGVLFKEL
jgi:fatty acid-binding protein DegV